MTIDLIIGIVTLVALALVFARWKLARVVLVQSLSHPLRTTVIEVKSTNGNDAEQPMGDKRKAQQRVVVNN